MDNVINEYQKWKQQGEQLRMQAKQAMESRFHELLAEAVQIAEEYRRDFAVPLKPPPNITAFRFKTAGGKKAKKKSPAPQPEEPSAAEPSPKVAALRKQRAQLQKKLEVAKAAGKPTKNLDDRIYEVEDELRLAGDTV